METRVKTLYIITIIAIIAFLSMQVYWLYGRYEYSLADYERARSETILKCIADYNAFREKHTIPLADTLRDGMVDQAFSVPTFSLRQEYGDTVRTTRTARLYTYLFSAHELLGLEPGTPLSDDQKSLAAELAQQQMTAPADSAVFDASGARDETEAWRATNSVFTQRKCPFTVQGMDSVLRKDGIEAHISLHRADSAVWRSRVVPGSSVLSPQVTVSFPYSQLEGLTVLIVSPVHPFDVLPGMWQTLMIALAVSVLLILCLLLQFSTILKLTRLDAMRNSFVTTMIHELKRPLSTLKMCVSGLGNERMMRQEDAKNELLAETRNALDNLSAYFSKLRDITFNRVEQIPLDIQSVRLHDLFSSVCGALVLPADKKVVIDNEIDAETVVSADRSHLYNILNNLVENAVKYSGSSVTIKATATAGDGMVEIRIADDGNGIPESDIGHVFKRFYRAAATAPTQPGIGLGLAYVKLLAEAHGGEAEVESTEGEGSCFIIRLPQ